MFPFRSQFYNCPITMNNYRPTRRNQEDSRNKYRNGRGRNYVRFGDYRSKSNHRDYSQKRKSKQNYFSSESETEKERENSNLQSEKEVQSNSIDVGSKSEHPKQQQMQEQVGQKTISQSQKNQHLTPLAQEFLQEIQNLDYKKLNFYELQHQFKEIVKGHIVFKEIYPQSQSSLGTLLITNGLFHEMWGKVVLVKYKENNSFWVYYQKYQNLLQKNHSNFESIFNQCNSMSSEIAENLQHEEDTNSCTNLYGHHKKFQKQPINPYILRTIKQDQMRQDNSENESVSHRTIDNLNFSSKENLIPTQDILPEVNKKERLRNFGFVQTNQRRLNAEIVCFFLSINSVYRLQNVHFSQVLQAQLTNQTQIVLLQGQVQAYCEQIKRKALSYMPKLLLIAYGEVNLATLLRLKNTYGKIQGLVVYDELIDIKKWLKTNGLLDEDY